MTTLKNTFGKLTAALVASAALAGGPPAAASEVVQLDEATVPPESIQPLLHGLEDIGKSRLHKEESVGSIYFVAEAPTCLIIEKVKGAETAARFSYFFRDRLVMVSTDTAVFRNSFDELPPQGRENLKKLHKLFDKGSPCPKP